MFARVAGWEPMPTDDRSWVLEAAKSVPGVRETFHLIDPETGNGLSVGVYDSREAISAAHAAIEQRAREIGWNDQPPACPSPRRFRRSSRPTQRSSCPTRRRAGPNTAASCCDCSASSPAIYETWRVVVSESSLPLGVTCIWTDPAARHVVRQEPSWTPTVVASANFGLGLVWVTAVGLSRLRRGPSSHRGQLPR